MNAGLRAAWRQVTPWNLSLLLNLGVVAATFASPAEGHTHGWTSILALAPALAFGWLAWRFLFSFPAGHLAKRLIFLVFVFLVLLCAGFVVNLGYLPDRSIVGFMIGEPRYALGMVVDRLSAGPIVAAVLTLALATAATRRSAIRPLRRPALALAGAAVALAAMLFLPGASPALESHLLGVAVKSAVESTFHEPVDRFVAARQPLGPQSCDPDYRPNVLLIQLEEIPASELGTSRRGRITAPFLQDWARREPAAFRFLSRHYATSSATEVSLYTMLTGLDPAHTGVELARQPLVWDYLHACGYTTAYGVPFDLGWSGMRGKLSTAGRIGTDLFFDTHSPKHLHFDYEINVRDDRVVDWLLEHLAELSARPPFLAIINLQLTHSKGGGVKILGQRHFACRGLGLDDYECAIYEEDVQLKRVVAELDRLGLLADTLIIGAADHGTDLDGRRTRLESFYQDVVVTPFFVYLPEHLRQHRPDLRLADRVSQHADIVPTVLDAVGLRRAPDNAAFLDALDGRSLFSSEAPRFLDFLNINAIRDWRTYDVGVLYDGRLKYLVHGGREELYDVIADPAERVDLVEQPERAADLAELRRHVAANPTMAAVRARE